MKKTKKRRVAKRKHTTGAHQVIAFHEDKWSVDAQLDERWDITPRHTAQDYLAQKEAERQAFALYTSRQDANRDVLENARRGAIYGKEILGTEAGRRAVSLIEKLIETLTLAKHLSLHPSGTRLSAAGDKERFLYRLADFLTDESLRPVEESDSLLPLERCAFLMAEFVRSSFCSLKEESGEYFSLYGAGCAKRRKPKQLHRAVIAGLLEARRLEVAANELSKLAPTRTVDSTDEASVDPLDTDSLFRRFCSALKLTEATESERKSNYTSFMRTLKDMEEERLVPRVPRAKTGKKPKSESSVR